VQRRQQLQRCKGPCPTSSSLQLVPRRAAAAAAAAAAAQADALDSLILVQAEQSEASNAAGASAAMLAADDWSQNRMAEQTAGGMLADTTGKADATQHNVRVLSSDAAAAADHSAMLGNRPAREVKVDTEHSIDSNSAATAAEHESSTAYDTGTMALETDSVNGRDCSADAAATVTPVLAEPTAAYSPAAAAASGDVISSSPSLFSSRHTVSPVLAAAASPPLNFASSQAALQPPAASLISPAAFAPGVMSEGCNGIISPELQPTHDAAELQTDNTPEALIVSQDAMLQAAEASPQLQPMVSLRPLLVQQVPATESTMQHDQTEAAPQPIEQESIELDQGASLYQYPAAEAGSHQWQTEGLWSDLGAINASVPSGLHAGSRQEGPTMPGVTSPATVADPLNGQALNIAADMRQGVPADQPVTTLHAQVQLCHT